MAHQEMLLSWLKDAYAMETSLIPTLENHAKDLSHIPQAQARIQQHVEETRRHADMVRSCIERLGGDVSTIKTGISNIGGMIKELPLSLAKDEVVKNTLADFATENFEIACYISLIAGAEMIGDQQTASICRQILDDERKMAEWVLTQLPTVTQAFLGEQARSHGA